MRIETTFSCDLLFCHHRLGTHIGTAEKRRSSAGEIVLLGRLFGVATPVNAAVQQAVASVAVQQGGVGQVRPAELLHAAASL